MERFESREMYSVHRRRARKLILSPAQQITGNFQEGVTRRRMPLSWKMGFMYSVTREQEGRPV